MQVIAVLNQKGGAGKTTLATHIARGLQLSGKSTLLVDSDPQGSARDWAAVREDHPLTVIGIDRPTIDAPGADSVSDEDPPSAGAILARAPRGEGWPPR